MSPFRSLARLLSPITSRFDFALNTRSTVAQRSDFVFTKLKRWLQMPLWAGLSLFLRKARKKISFMSVIAANLTSCLESGPQLKRSPKVVKHKDAAEFLRQPNSKWKFRNFPNSSDCNVKCLETGQRTISSPISTACCGTRSARNVTEFYDICYNWITR